ncbi:MAG: hypothetical protein LBG44_04500, partial [Gemmatimonadota bacterium]|nr:hypothetical protein [Gemmatimonadota bacterium]
MRTLLVLTGIVGFPALGVVNVVSAQVTIDPTWNGVNHTGNTFVLSDGATVTLNGAFTLAPTTPPGTFSSLWDLQQAGYASGLPASYQSSLPLYLGVQGNGVFVFNPNPPFGTISYSAYSSGQFVQIGDAFAPNTAPFVTGVPTYTSAADANIYSDLRFATVTDGTLNVNITSAALGNASGLSATTQSIGGKNTALFMAQGTGTVVLSRDMNVAFLGSSTQPLSADPNLVLNEQTVMSAATTFTGAFTAYDGSTQTVTDLASLRTYNDWLIARLQLPLADPNRLSTDNYTAELAKAYATTFYNVTYDPTVGNSISPGDPLFDPTVKQVIAQADGVGASASVASGVNVWIGSGDLTGIVAGLYGSNGGTVINDGLIGSSGPNANRVMFVNNGGRGINNGVLAVGYHTTLANNAAVVAGANGAGTIGASGTGSQFTNNGIVNIASLRSGVIGLQVDLGATGVNNGVFNIVGPLNSNVQTIVGVDVLFAGTSFTNAADGLIYLGRGPSANMSSADRMDWGGADTPISVAATTGIWARGGTVANRATAVNDGRIVIGSQVVNASALRGEGAASVTNNGIIDINGGTSGGLIGLNRGMFVTVTNAIGTNAGTINLNSINSIGLHVTSNATATSSGTINVNGGLDPATQSRNYGIVSEGSPTTVATLSGTVNLNGDYGIGLFARDRGQINVTGSGAVVFDAGARNQIGYYVLGAGAAINNTSSATQNVVSRNSTLYRMEGGADFTGGTGATSVLTASGDSSIAVVVTGVAGTDVSAFNSGGMTINASGTNATGLLVQGGAQGRIAANAVINLTGVGAVAGIADGQGYDITGALSGGPVIGHFVEGSTANAGAGSTFGTGTILVAGANLSSTLNEVTGYIARNGAELVNSGNLNFTGAGTTGVRVEDGSTGTNSGTITVGAGGVGVTALGSSDLTKTTTVNIFGTVNANGGSTSQRTSAVLADGANAAINMTTGNINLNGVGAIGSWVTNGAAIHLSNVVVSFTNRDQIGFLASGENSRITSTAAALNASTTNSRLFRVDDGAAYYGSSQLLTASGDSSIILASSGASSSGRKSLVDTQDATLNVSGRNAWGIRVDGGAEAFIRSGTTVNLAGTGSIAGVVDGRTVALDGALSATTAASTLTNEATIISTTDGVTAFITRYDGTLINDGVISLSSGTGNTGIIAQNGGNLDNRKNITVASGLGVLIDGAGSATGFSNTATIQVNDGTAGLVIRNGASVNSEGLGDGSGGAGNITTNGTAHGVLIDTGAAGVRLGANTIQALGTGSGIENGAEISAVSFAGTRVVTADGAAIRTATSFDATPASTATLTVTGSGTGFLFQKADGTAASGNLALGSGYTITVDGTSGTNGGTGVMANSTGTMANAATVRVTDALGGSAVRFGTAVTGGSNSGTLASASTLAATVNAASAATFSNTGSISNTGTGYLRAVEMSAADATLNNTGTITGNVAMLGNNATVNVGAVGSAGTVTGAVQLLGAGANRVLITGGSTVDRVESTAGSTDTVTIRGAGNRFTTLAGTAGDVQTAVFDDANYTLSDGSAIVNYDQVNLINGSVMTLQTTLGGDPAGGAGIYVAGGTTLAVAPAPAGAYTLANALTGTGLVTVTTGAGNAFHFAATTGDAFAGTVALKASTFALSGDNTVALKNATLRLDSASVTRVGANDGVDTAETIHSLTFNGGTLVFGDTLVVDADSPDYLVTTGVLNLAGTGTVQVALPESVINPAPAARPGLPL